MARKYFTAAVICAGFMGAILKPVTLAAQEAFAPALEEIVVTAQRRAQPVQNVPISIEVFRGSEIRKQGFRDLDDLANYSPTVLILARVQDQDISIRGIGTTGNALTLDQAVPTFVDGIHFGRSSQVRLAFMDLESVEVLKGPQPVYFGQNATAGAINIRSRRPGDSWESNLDVELASHNTRAVDFGMGGPLGDHWGLRVAARYDDTDGFLKDIVSGKRLGAHENLGARTILQWSPSDQWQVTFKAEASRIRKDGETTYLCRTDGPMIFGRNGPTDDPGVPPGDERSVWEEPPVGSGWNVPFTKLDTRCFTSDKGVSNGGPYYQPPAYIREENSNFGALDIREAAEAFTRSNRNKTTSGYEDIDATNGYLEVAYELDNGITANWLSGWNDYDRDYALDNSNSPFLMNLQARGEKYDQLSSEIRLDSAPGGRFEWMLGASWQQTDLFAWSSSLRANVRQMQRYNEITEEVEYKNLFFNLTFNFLDQKASIDLGGRYADIDKFTTAIAYGAEWIYDIEPVSAGELGEDYFELTGEALEAARLYLPPAEGASLWYMPFRGSRNIPVEWLGANARAIGLTAPDYNASRLGGPWAETLTARKFSPQVTVRYRPNEQISIYARYAESFKIGGFDTGQTSIPDNIEEFRFDSEDSESFELGVKGMLLEGRFAFDASLFHLEIPNLQTNALSPDPDQNTASINAGQRVRGLEFSSQFAATERLVLGFSGALMDGVMTDFQRAGCTSAELVDPDSGCVLDDPEDPGEGGLIDRSGTQAPRTPDWKFVLSANYRFPVFGDYEFYVNATGYLSDGYILDVESFDKTVMYNQHGDMNLMAGIGDSAGKWVVSLFARNLFEARPSYNARYDTFPNGLAGSGDDTGVQMGPSSFVSYGVKFEYRLR
jgi:outer membrane receptor protein involved in Fe transport